MYNFIDDRCVETKKRIKIVSSDFLSFFLCNFFHLRFTKHPSLYYSLNETYIVRMYRIEAITQVNKNNKD